MKKLLFALFLLLPYISFGQITIPMEKQPSGTYLIPCKVNDVPMKFIFDTGASNVSISLTEALFLIKNGHIEESDIRGTSYAKIANGDIVENTEILLRKIEIGGIVLNDVEASVSHELEAPLLLGQSAIQRLGKISLEGNILTIHTDTTYQARQNYNREELDKKLRYLRETRDINHDSQYETLEIIEKIEKYSQLNEFELFCKTTALGNLDKFDETISAAQTWIDKYALETDSIDWKMRVFYNAAKANILGEKGDKEKGMDYLQRCRNYWETSTNSAFYWEELSIIMFDYDKYIKIGYDNSIRAAKNTTRHFLELDHLSLSDINNNKCMNWEKGFCLWYLWSAYSLQGAWYQENNKNYKRIEQEYTKIKIACILAAKVGVKEAIETLKSMNTNYKKKLTKSELSLIGLE